MVQHLTGVKVVKTQIKYGTWWSFASPPSMPYSVMVAHKNLTLVTLVRIQLGQLKQINKKKMYNIYDIGKVFIYDVL